MFDQGIAARRIDDTPIAVLDFETTGLTPGYDRVVEIGVVRRDPGGPARVVLDTLVNPLRPISATEIHGITDQDVENAPTFQQVAGDLLAATTGCVLCAYNVYFDMRFLLAELRSLGVHAEPPHFCLMYMRPMLGVGKRCRLEEACKVYNISFQNSHMAGQDVLVSAELLDRYLAILKERGIHTFADLANLKKYKFIDSFRNPPLAGPAAYRMVCGKKFLSRNPTPASAPRDDTKHKIRQYWDALKTVLADMEISDDELSYIVEERKRLQLPKELVRTLHARAFMSVLTQFSQDQKLDDREVLVLRQLHRCLSRLGWAPGE